MTRDLILGTAGHIDHGKTSLVKALTGIDCDRLPEEKERGITIDIGFAKLDLGEFRLGIVDVPGHERFIKNMLAGATGIDLVVLVIAADDSIMPQTREHLEILRLLGIKHGVIALTKADLVDETTRDVAMLEIRDLVQDSFLRDAPIVPTSTVTGFGMDDLKAAIVEECRKVETQAGDTWFRLPIDRAFTVQGHGTVITGSVISGSVHVGEEVEWLPRRERVRIRAMHSHDQPVETVHRGQRAAINLAGISLEDVQRGQELATPGFLIPSSTVTVRMHALADVRRPLKHRAQVRLHLGTSEAMARLSLLNDSSLAPGQWGLAQLFLDSPVTATWGQPFVIRDSSAEHTLGGGQVLQPVAEKIRRRHLDVIERVEQLWSGAASVRAETIAWFSGFTGVSVADLVRGGGFSPTEAKSLLHELHQAHRLVQIDAAHGPPRLVHKDLIAELDEKLLDELAKMHQLFPLMTSHDRQKVQAMLVYIGDDGLVHAAVDRMLRQHRLTGDSRRIARADFKPKLSANLRKLKDRVVEAFQTARFQPPEPSSFAKQAGGNAGNLNDLFDVCIAEGYLARIAPDIYLHADAEAEMRKLITERLRTTGAGLTVADIRDMLGTTRKFAVPLCEYLDSVGVTKRDGDLRVLASS
jgi:selenocysteine-specific elongation factor